MFRRSRFATGLTLVAVVAFVVRTLYALHVRDAPVVGDALTFHLVGQGLADGKGFVEAFPPGGPTAEHPPMMEVVLGAVDWLGITGYLGHRIVLGALGVVTVVLIGLVGRRVGGVRVGLTAASLAAIAPMLVSADGSLMSETVYGVFLVGTLLLALRLRERASAGRAAALGAVIALAALSRGEALALLVLLAAPVVYAAGAGWRARATTYGVVLAAAIAVLAPWTIFNATRFEDPVLISTNSNGVFVGANCPDTYGGPLIGSWRFQCYTPRRPGEDESQFYIRQRKLGIDYALDHADRWPAVVVARLTRLFDIGRFDQSLFVNASEGRPVDVMRWAIRVSWLALLLAIVGAVVLALRRRRVALAVLLAPVVMVIGVATVTYGGTRFRFGAEPSIVLLSAVAVVAAVEAVMRRRGDDPAGDV